jgi:peptidyl-prolyl cis-trans isomerase B (cyclophilin B)
MTDLELDPARLEAVIETDKGEMVVTFFPDKAPKTVQSFLSLASKQFYDGLKFHRVIKNFMIQTGCPEGTGTGGPGYTVPAEFNDTPHTRGTLSMARAGHPDSAGSQFFIVHGDHADHLDGRFTAFGRVTRGLEVLDAIAGTPCDFGPNGERSTPKQPIHMRRVSVRERTDDRSDAASSPAAGEAEAGT